MKERSQSRKKVLANLRLGGRLRATASLSLPGQWVSYTFALSFCRDPEKDPNLPEMIRPSQEGWWAWNTCREDTNKAAREHSAVGVPCPVKCVSTEHWSGGPLACVRFSSSLVRPKLI